jgi:hypothetical protein
MTSVSASIVLCGISIEIFLVIDRVEQESLLLCPAVRPQQFRDSPNDPRLQKLKSFALQR